MSDQTVAATAPTSSTASAKKGKVTSVKPKKSPAAKAPAAHPPSVTIVTMVLDAVTKLNEKKGSSLYAIKKFIADIYKFDVEKKAPYIRKALKKLIDTGTLTRPRGTGASGSFKLTVKPKHVKAAAAAKKPSAAAMPKVKKAASSTKKAVAIAKPKKTTTTTKPTAASPTKVKKVVASPKNVVKAPAAATATKAKKRAPAKPKAPKKGRKREDSAVGDDFNSQAEDSSGSAAKRAAPKKQ
jgi:histone H1/5